MTTAGELDRRITIERATETRDEYNSPVRTWATLATVWAKREDVSDAELIAAGELGSSLGARFTVRRMGDAATVTPSDRLQHDGAVWNIQAVREKRDEGLAFLEIRAVREVG